MAEQIFIATFKMRHYFWSFKFSKTLTSLVTKYLHYRSGVNRENSKTTFYNYVMHCWTFCFYFKLGMVVHAFNTSTWKAVEAGRSASSKSAWSTKWVLQQLRQLCREILPSKNKQKTKTENEKIKIKRRRKWDISVWYKYKCFSWMYMCTWYLWLSEESIGSSGTRVVDGYKPSCGCGNIAWVFCEG